MPYNGPLIKLTSECLVPEPLIDIFYRDDCGAIVTFVGTIRNTSKDGNRVKSLKIDVYDNEAEERLITIASDFCDKARTALEDLPKTMVRQSLSDLTNFTIQRKK